MSKYEKKELYFSIDIEADGPIPGQFSMLSFGVAVFDLESSTPLKPLACFSSNLALLPDAKVDPDTSEFWSRNPEAYAQTRVDACDPTQSMARFVAWAAQICEEHDGRPIAVAYPGSYDFMFLYWYLIRFAESSPFGFQCLDIKTLAMAALDSGYKSATKSKFPKRWFDGAGEHTHIALDDAVEQGVLFCNIMRDLRALSARHKIQRASDLL